MTGILESHAFFISFLLAIPDINFLSSRDSIGVIMIWTQAGVFSSGKMASSGSFHNYFRSHLEEKTSRLYTPGLDNTRLFMSLTAGAGT